MPGPGLDLLGAEELAEVAEVINSATSEPLRPGRRVVPGQGAALRGGGRAPGRRPARPGGQLRDERSAPRPRRPRHRSRRRGHRPRLHVRRDHLLRRATPAPARSWPRSTTRSTSIRATSRRASRRARGRSSRSTCWAIRPAWTSSRRSPTATGWPSSRTPRRPSGPPTGAAGSVATGWSASTASTSTRPSPAATAACSSRTTRTCTGAPSRCTTRATAQPQGRRGRQSPVPGPQLPDDRAGGRRAPGAGAPAGPDPRPPRGRTATSSGHHRHRARGSRSATSRIPRATSPRTSWSSSRTRSAEAVTNELGSITLATPAGTSTTTWSTSWRSGRSPDAAVRSTAPARTPRTPDARPGCCPDRRAAGAVDELLDRRQDPTWRHSGCGCATARTWRACRPSGSAPSPASAWGRRTPDWAIHRTGSRAASAWRTSPARPGSPVRRHRGRSSTTRASARPATRCRGHRCCTTSRTPPLAGCVRRTRTLGLLLADLSDPVHGQIAAAFEQEAAGHGYRVIVGAGMKVPAGAESSRSSWSTAPTASPWCPVRDPPGGPRPGRRGPAGRRPPGPSGRCPERTLPGPQPNGRCGRGRVAIVPPGRVWASRHRVRRERRSAVQAAAPRP